MLDPKQSSLYDAINYIGLSGEDKLKIQHHDDLRNCLVKDITLEEVGVLNTIIKDRATFDKLWNLLLNSVS